MNLLWLIGALAIFCFDVEASSSLADIQARGRLVVSVKNIGAQQHSKHKDPAHFEKRGVEIELAHAIAARALGDPNKIEFKMMRKPLRIPAVANGDVDLAISMVHVTPTAEKQVDFSIPYYEGGTAVMERATANITSLTELSGKRLGIIARNDSNTADILTEMPANTRPTSVAEFANFDDAATAIRTGKIDALLSEGANISVYVEAHGDGLKKSPALTHDQIAVAIQKGNTELMGIVNQVVKELRDSGKLASMFDASHIGQQAIANESQQR